MSDTHNDMKGFSMTRLMLKLTDNEEFYEEEKPLPLEDIRCLIVILRQVNLTE